MQHVARVASFGRHVFSFVLHFAHGGLVVAGLIVTLFIGFKLSRHGLDGLMIGRPAAAVSAETGTEAAKATATDELRSPEIVRLSEYLARRYRVSRAAIEPLVGTAHQTGRAVGLDPLLIIAVMAVESSFNPFAESPFGAQGLMQVVPRFHRDKFTADGSESAALLDPQENIRVGALVLKEYLRRNGSLEAALQQYAGAPEDPAAGYAGKVIAEKARLQQAMHSGMRAAGV